MKHVTWLSLLLLLSCGGKDTITFEQYRDQHLKDHQAHLDLLHLEAPLIDTLFDQCLESLRNPRYPNQGWSTWVHVEELLQETLHKSHVYAHNVIMNDATLGPVTQLWKAENTMDIQLAVLRDDVERGVGQHGTTQEAIDAIVSLRETVRREMRGMVKAEKEYMKACS